MLRIPMGVSEYVSSRVLFTDSSSVRTTNKSDQLRMICGKILSHKSTVIFCIHLWQITGDYGLFIHVKNSVVGGGVVVHK
jgi:hypothetical protein